MFTAGAGSSGTRTGTKQQGIRVARAIWNDAVIAESAEYEEVEGNIYFPPDSVSEDFLQKSDTQSRCPWKGMASYLDVVVDGEVNRDAAWYYPDPRDAAARIKDHVAFWRGVTIEK